MIFLNYEYSKSNYRLMVLDRSRQKGLDADPKAIQQIVFAKQLKDEDDVNESGVNAQSMFVLTLSEIIKGARLKFSQGSVTVLQNLANSEEARCKLTNSQLNKLKPAAKDKTGTTFRITRKNVQDEELPH